MRFSQAIETCHEVWKDSLRLCWAALTFSISKVLAKSQRTADACMEGVRVSRCLPPVEEFTTVMDHLATSAAPEEDAEQYVALAIEARRLRPRRTTGGTEHSYIWTTEHHLAAAAEALAETSVPLQVTCPEYLLFSRKGAEAHIDTSACTLHVMSMPSCRGRSTGQSPQNRTELHLVSQSA